MDKDVINELNAFLKGQYMGIHAYENLIQNEKDENIKRELQGIQKSHKAHAATVAVRIQNLGGRPVDDEGLLGSMQETIVRLFGTPKGTRDTLESALKGEDHYGIKMSEEIVKGDLDQESHAIIKQILDEDRIHVGTLNTLLQNTIH
jgi:bacterioferritin